jgi:L-alanine-DL-glutamate epimerase-like enolase superfamily enzyme
VAKLPIHRLLGTCRESVPAYASSAYLPTPEAYVEEALHFLSLGWPAYMLRGDVMVTGGITPLIKVAHMADGFRMKCEIHHGGNSLGNGANKYGLVEDIEVDKQGFVHAPQKPGLGFEIDWELVKRNKVAVLN